MFFRKKSSKLIKLDKSILPNLTVLMICPGRVTHYFNHNFGQFNSIENYTVVPKIETNYLVTFMSLKLQDFILNYMASAKIPFDICYNGRKFLADVNYFVSDTYYIFGHVANRLFIYAA
jgi:hypothetical protein